MNPELKPCPFCGSSIAPSLQDTEEAGRLPTNDWQVVCDFTNRGCGGSSGFRPTQEKAIELWNTRIL